jgi:hypothetical protein
MGNRYITEAKTARKYIDSMKHYHNKRSSMWQGKCKVGDPAALIIW